MGIVWDCDLPQNHKLVLLAYADHADHDGGSIFPSINLIAYKTGYSERSVQRITRELEEAGYLQYVGKSDYQTNSYKIAIEKLPIRTPTDRGDKMTPPTDRTPKRGDKLTGGGDTSDTPGGDTHDTQTIILNHQLKPSEVVNATPNIFQVHNACIGPITKTSADKLNSLLEDYPESWIIDALYIAKEREAKTVNYIEPILANWNLNGRNGKLKGKANEPAGYAGIREYLAEQGMTIDDLQ